MASEVLESPYRARVSENALRLLYLHARSSFGPLVGPEAEASGSSDHTVKIWEAESGRAQATLEGHTNLVNSVVWHPSGTRLASGSDDQTVKIWEAESGQLLDTLTGHEDWVQEVSWHANGDRLAVATLSGSLYLWDLSGPEPLCLARLYEASPVTGLVVTHDGFVDGPQSALDNVRFADGWALYDLDDVPERHSPERVREVLAWKGTKEDES